MIREAGMPKNRSCPRDVGKFPMKGDISSVMEKREMPREIIQPEGQWDPSPHFAHVAKHGKHVYVAGQTATDPDGNRVGKGDIEAQSRQVFENIRRCLESAGATFDDVVKLNIYSTDIGAHQPTVSKIRQGYFPKENVPSTFVEIARLRVPELLLEIEAIAILD